MYELLVHEQANTSIRATDSSKGQASAATVGVWQPLVSGH